MRADSGARSVLQAILAMLNVGCWILNGE